MAPPLPPGLVARPGPLATLRKLLLVKARDQLVTISTRLPGVGGFGKTTLAIAFCHNPAVRAAFPDGILWATLGKRPLLLVEMARLTAALTGRPGTFVDLHDATRQLVTALGEKRCLLVVDDAWEREDLRPFLQGGPLCARLITARKSGIPSIGRRVVVDAMTDAEAVLLLAGGWDMPPAEAEPWQALAGRLGNRPLLLAQASAALRARLAAGEAPDQALAVQEAALIRAGARAPAPHTQGTHQRAGAASVAVSLDLLAADERPRCVELAIFPPAVAVPLPTVAALWGRPQAEAARLAARLADRALIQFDAATGTLVLPDVVREVLAGQVADAGALHARLLAAWGDPHSPPDAYAWDHLADHLLAAGRSADLRRLLLDFSWLQARLAQGGIAALLADADHLGLDETVRPVAAALRLAAPHLAADPQQLAAQLLARLTTAADPAIAALLLEAGRHSGGPWLRPLFPRLIAAGSPLLRVLSGHRGEVNAVALTPDGRRAVSAADDHTLKVWDLGSGVVLHTLEGHTDWVRAVAVTPDGQRAVSGSTDRTLKVWDLNTGMELRTLQGHDSPIRAVAVTPDGQQAVSGFADGTLQVWDLGTGTALRTGEARGGEVHAVALTPDGRRAIAAYEDGMLRVWDLPSGDELRTLSGHWGAVMAVAVTPDGQRAVSGSADRTLKVWDLNTGAPLHTLIGHLGWVTAVAVTSDGQRVVSASDDATLQVWDLDNRTVPRSLPGAGAPLKAVALTSDGQRAVCGTWAGTLQVWDLNDTVQSLPSDQSNSVEVVAVTSDGRRAVTGASDGTVQVWDLSSGRVLRTLHGHGGSVAAIALTGDGQRAVTGAWEGPPEVWDLTTGATLRTLADPPRRVRAVALTADEQQLVTVTADGTQQIADLTTGAILRTLASPARYILGAAVAVGGQRVLTSAADGTLQIWDLTSGAELHALQGHDDAVHALTVTADGRRAVSGATDGTLRVWDLRTGQAVRTLAGHPGAIWALAITADGQRVVSGATDETLRVWDVRSGELVAWFGGAEEPTGGFEGFSCCAIAPDGVTVVAGKKQGRVLFLRLEGVEERAGGQAE